MNCLPPISAHFVSIADKLDTICGCFGVGLIPTGSADPYALRRAAIGIIAIILDKEYRLSLPKYIDLALDLLQEKLTAAQGEGLYRHHGVLQGTLRQPSGR